MKATCPICQKPLPKRPLSHPPTYCSRTCAGLAKRTLPTMKVCEMCGKEWAPMTSYQAARNKTCSRACSALMLSRQRVGIPRGKTAERVTLPCATCGLPVTKRVAALKYSKQTFCSRTCMGKERAKALIPFSGNMKGRKRKDPRYGSDNPAWKGGITFKRNKGNYIGPKYVRCPADLLAMARADGYVMEHRLVMARWVGRPLARIETVHHLDHRTRHNERGNLELWPDNQSHKAAEGGRCAPDVACRWSPTGLALP